MAVRFEKNAYFKVIKEEAALNSEEKIVDYAKNHQQFNYGNVTFKKFKDRHTTTEGWLGRKVIALPAVLWSGVVKTIYHLAKAILVGGDSPFRRK